MSPRVLLFSLVGLLLSACGSEPATSSGRFGLELVMQGAVASDLSTLQVAVLKEGSRRSCTELQSTCLRTQVAREDLLVIEDAQGHEGRALRFPVNLESLQSGNGQALEVDVPVGRDYALVLEAMSGGSPARFLGSSCNYLKEVNSGSNAAVIAAPLVLTDKDCNPSIEP